MASEEFDESMSQYFEYCEGIKGMVLSNQKKNAYRTVLEDLKKIGVFCGKGGKDSAYMYGVNAVMEFIAYSIDEKTGDSFSDMFFKNMRK